MTKQMNSKIISDGYKLAHGVWERLKLFVTKLLCFGEFSSY